jgi:hypothetical protein
MIHISHNKKTKKTVFSQFSENNQLIRLKKQNSSLIQPCYSQDANNGLELVANQKPNQNIMETEYKLNKDKRNSSMRYGEIIFNRTFYLLLNKF